MTSLASFDDQDVHEMRELCRLHGGNVHLSFALAMGWWVPTRRVVKLDTLTFANGSTVELVDSGGEEFVGSGVDYFISI